MNTHPTLATHFSTATRTLRSALPLREDQMHLVAPSIFAAGRHCSRSERYAYIPTIEVLRALRREGFEPFMVAQGRCRVEDRTQYTKHMIRLRHAGDIARAEANEIILINSHDGASAYQMLAGLFRFACSNGLVCGTALDDVRVPHRGDAAARVVDGAFTVLDGFRKVAVATDAMKRLPLDADEQAAYARATAVLRFGPERTPVAPEQLLTVRRPEDLGDSLWSTFQRVSENALRGGLPGRSAGGRRVRTRPVEGIDRSVMLNRALWVLAEEMARLKH